ncbi:ornithine decarboxylase antizyme-domain-containing protein [Mycena rebaudengoi]|nr:ornithine decarboxylase antizyme-domain-containing protein [Mycena rebaudengoi]
MSNFIKQKSSLGPTNGRQTVGDGAALSFDTEPSVLAVCHLEGNDDMYYYSTTFSGGPGVSVVVCSSIPSNYFYHASHPLPIPASRVPLRSHSSDLATPPLTPDDDDDDSDSESGSTAVRNKNQKDGLDFLMTLFPRHGLSALSFSKSVAISAPNMGAAFDGVVLQLPGQPKTLYVDGKSAQSVSIRESIVALLDLADESLECSALVIALERSSPSLGSLLHSLMYVGGTVVTKPPFEVDPAFVLVGLEI